MDTLTYTGGTLVAGGVQADGDGNHTLSCTATDRAGNQSTASHAVHIDGTQPTATLMCGGSPCGAGWYTSHIALTLGASDATSGVASAQVSLDGGATWVNSATLADGVYSVQGRSIDNAGNVSAIVYGTISVDTTAPLSSWTVADNSWVGGVAMIGGVSTDGGSGVALVEVSINGGPWVSAGTSSPWSYAWNTIGLSETATYTIEARATDAAGNVEHTAIVHLHVDNTAPALTLPNTPMGFDPTKTEFISSDLGSGLSHAQVTFSGNGITPRVNVYPTLTGTESIGWDGRDGTGRPVPPGTYDVRIDVWDRVGNHTNTFGQWVVLQQPTETSTPTRLPSSTPRPKDTATDTRVPVRNTATRTNTLAPGVTPTATPVILPIVNLPLPQLPLGIPAGMLFLPLIAAGLWLVGSSAAFLRDRRGTELRALSRSVNQYLSQSKINSQGGEEND